MDNVEVITLSKKNISDFASARNQLFFSAKKDWILFLDSDEVLSGRKLQVSDKFNGYYLIRKNYFLDKPIGTDLIIRLGKKNSGTWTRMVHETWGIKGRVGTIYDPVIIHNTAETLSAYIKKLDYYSTLHAKANKEEGKTSSIFKIIFFPQAKFITTLIKSKNVVFAIMQAFHSFLAWSKLYFLRS